MRISDWSSDVCSSDLGAAVPYVHARPDLPVATAPAPTTGPMARRERFDGPALPLDWMMLRNPAGHWYRLGGGATQSGRASCRERGGQYVEISVVAVSLKKKITTITRSVMSSRSRYGHVETERLT